VVAEFKLNKWRQSRKCKTLETSRIFRKEEAISERKKITDLETKRKNKI
jgi:hypothetical protein